MSTSRFRYRYQYRPGNGTGFFHPLPGLQPVCSRRIRCPCLDRWTWQGPGQQGLDRHAMAAGATAKFLHLPRWIRPARVPAMPEKTSLISPGSRRALTTRGIPVGPSTATSWGRQCTEVDGGFPCKDGGLTPFEGQDRFIGHLEGKKPSGWNRFSFRDVETATGEDTSNWRMKKATGFREGKLHEVLRFSRHCPGAHGRLLQVLFLPGLNSRRLLHSV